MMYFAWMKQIIKQIFRSLHLYITILFFISCISVYMIGPIRDNYTAINGKEYKDNEKWIYSLDNKKGETVLSTTSFEDLNISDTYFDTNIIIVIIIIIMTIGVLLIYFCYVCRKIVFPTLDVEPAVVRRDVPVHFRNNRIVFGSDEYSSDDEL